MSSNYSVAWLDTKKNKNKYKSIFIHGEFCDKSNLSLNKSSILKIPFNIKIINNISINIFNYLYFFYGIH